MTGARAAGVGPPPGRRRWRPSGRSRVRAAALAAALAAGVVGGRSPGAVGQETGCPTFPYLPTTLVPDSAPSATSYRVMGGFAGRGHLGVGHLLPPDSAWGWGWQDRVRLALYEEPGGRLRGWIFDGWLVELGAGARAVPLQTAAMLETAYEEASFLVVEARADGWLRVQVLPPPGFDPAADSYPRLIGDPVETAAWTPRCHLGASGVGLAYETWAELFLRLGRPLFFREEVPHALRARPGVEAERLRWIPADRYEHRLEPLEVMGDWMRVSVRVPSDYCVGPDEIETREAEGWVQWRGPELGPWVWYYTRGC